MARFRNAKRKRFPRRRKATRTIRKKRMFKPPAGKVSDVTFQRGLAWSKSQVCKLNYTGSFILDTRSSPAEPFEDFKLVSANNVYDPELTNGIKSASGYVPWAQMYRRYKVLKSNIRVKYFYESEVTGYGTAYAITDPDLPGTSPHDFFVIPIRNSSDASEIMDPVTPSDGLSRQERVSQRMMNKRLAVKPLDFGRKGITISNWFTPKRMYNPWQTQGVAGQIALVDTIGTPSDDSCFMIMAQSSFGTGQQAMAKFRVEYTVTYTVMFMDPRYPLQEDHD